MIPGHRNFFGSKIGRSILGAVKGLNPLGIHSASGLRVHDTIDRTIMANRQLLKMLPKKPTVAEMGAKYFQGYNVADLATEAGVADDIVKNIGLSTSSAAERGFRQKVRVGTFAGLGAMTAGNWFLGDGNPLSSTLSFTARAAGHVAGGTALMGYHPLAGGAYLGATAINAFRGGDNWGPL